MADVIWVIELCIGRGCEIIVGAWPFKISPRTYFFFYSVRGIRVEQWGDSQIVAELCEWEIDGLHRPRLDSYKCVNPDIYTICRRMTDAEWQRLLGLRNEESSPVDIHSSGRIHVLYYSSLARRKWRPHLCTDRTNRSWEVTAGNWNQACDTESYHCLIEIPQNPDPRSPGG